jgi:hypothetical protein
MAVAQRHPPWSRTSTPRVMPAAAVCRDRPKVAKSARHDLLGAVDSAMEHRGQLLWQRWGVWVLAFALGLLPTLVVLSLSAYVHNDSDLAALRQRAEGMHVHALAAGPPPSPASAFTAMAVLASQIQQLKNNSTISMMPSSITREYLEEKPDPGWSARIRTAAQAWDEPTCAGIEDGVDRLLQAPLVQAIPPGNPWRHAATHLTIQDFLAVRLFIADPGQLAVRERRLARFLEDVDNRRYSPGFLTRGLRALAFRLGEIGPPQHDTAALLRAFAASLPTCLRENAASEYLQWESALAQPGLNSAMLGFRMPGIVAIPLLGAVEMRHGRALLLTALLDSVRDGPQLDAGSLAPPAGHDLRSARWSLLYLIAGSRASSMITAQAMLLARTIAARLDQDPLPADPRSADGRSLQVRERDGWRTTYGVAVDGRDHAEDARMDLVLFAEPAPAATPAGVGIR